MGKDLRTIAVDLRLHRCRKLNTEAWGLQQSQPFFPCLETLFKTDTIHSLQEYGVKLQEEIVSIPSPTTIVTSKGKTTTIHRKTTMIPSPFKWMRDDYGAIGLPKPEAKANDLQDKLQSPHTAGYVGAMTSILLSESECIHFPRVYGVYTGIATEHIIDISDDYEILMEKSWFADNIGKTFDLKFKSSDIEASFTHTRTQRPELRMGDDVDMEIEDVHADHVSEPSIATNITHSVVSQSICSHSSSMEEDDDDPFDIQSCDCKSEEEGSSEEDDEDMEPFVWAVFKNVPVITTVMEQCEGTFYDLLEKQPDPAKHSAWVAQLVMALAYAQRKYGFAHNDLHGNNVMFVRTTEDYLYYKHNGVSYRIPTFGYIIKIIDFDRCIVSVRLNSMRTPRQFVSSHFAENEEAAGQYNIVPFFNQHQPLLQPSSSFDLCRFATSLFWEMFPEGPHHEYSHPLFEVFKQWMLQSDGSSVMFRKQQDDHDRYHGFHLYKAIARYCKQAVPRQEIEKLTSYRISAVPLGLPALFIEE